jgi:hypothetical protein
LIKQAIRQAGKRLQVAGVICFLFAMACLSAAVGWGRGATGSEAGLADRYSVLAVPWLCCSYLGLLVFGGPLAKPLMGSLAIVTALMAVPNTEAGFAMVRDRYRRMEYARHDLDAGIPAEIFAQRYCRIPFLIYPNEKELASYLTALRRADVPRFRKLPTTLREKDN